jgi:hypothetical protein
MHVDNRELATILAALRFWQENNGPENAAESLGHEFECAVSVNIIATDCGELEPLRREEIDALCERINCED